MTQQQPPHGQPPQGYGPPPQGYGPPPGYGYAPQPAKAPWYHSGAIVGISLFFCWPIGLVLLWSSKSISTVTKLVGTAVFGGIGLIFVIGAMVGAGKQRAELSASKAALQSPTPASEPASEPVVAKRAAAPAAPTVETVTESCLTLATKFGTSSKLSDLQKDEAWKSYKGKAFEWKLKITEVSSGTFGGYSVQAKCAPQSPSLIQDIQISYDSDAKDFVMKLQKDDVYTLKGVLKNSSTLLGLMADGTP